MVVAFPEPPLVRLAREVMRLVVAVVALGRFPELPALPSLRRDVGSAAVPVEVPNADERSSLLSLFTPVQSVSCDRGTHLRDGPMHAAEAVPCRGGALQSPNSRQRTSRASAARAGVRTPSRSVQFSQIDMA